MTVTTLGEDSPAQEVVLVVEDDARVRQAIERELGASFEVKSCVTMAEAFDAIERCRIPFGAAIVDVRLPDGSGIRVLEALEGTDVPVLVLTGVVDPDVIRHAQRLGAQFLLKPLARENLQAFLERAARRHHTPGRMLEAHVHDLAERHGLSERERDVVLMAARGVASSTLHIRLGVSPNTAKTLVRRTLRKCGAGSIGELVGPLQEAVLSDPPGE